MIDLTLPIRDGEPPHQHVKALTSEKSVHDVTGATTHRIDISTHHGTHIDAPAHYVEGGPTVDEIDDEVLVGQAKVLDLRSERGNPITRDVLSSNPVEIDSGDAIVAVTGDVDERYFTPEFKTESSVFTPDAAQWLVEQGVSLVVHDFVTEAPDDRGPVHTTLLGAGIPIVENVCNTAAIADREEVTMACLPLALEGFEAVPTRVVVLDAP